MTTKHLINIGEVATNFDHSIDQTIKAKLIENPNKFSASHSAWNFNGTIYYDDNKFIEEIWVYGSKREKLENNSIEELIQEANNKYGSE